MTQDLTRTNEVSIYGTIGEQQVTQTFSKQVIFINSKDTKDNQWKQAEMEIYIKPDLMAQTGATFGDKVVLTGWLAFNFWNNRSFPRIVATNVTIVEKGGQPAAQAQPAAMAQQPAQNFNQPQQVAPQPTAQAPAGIPSVPDVPPMP